MKNASEELILAALLQHSTVKAAAAAAGVTERTMYTYLAKPDFKARYEGEKIEIVRSVTSRLQQSMNDAVSVILELMRSDKTPPFVRLNAAKTIMEQANGFTEANDFINRIESLESIIDEQNSGHLRAAN
jgi:hypothetical protein